MPTSHIEPNPSIAPSSDIRAAHFVKVAIVGTGPDTDDPTAKDLAGLPVLAEEEVAATWDVVERSYNHVLIAHSLKASEYAIETVNK